MSRDDSARVLQINSETWGIGLESGGDACDTMCFVLKSVAYLEKKFSLMDEVIYR